MKKIVFILLLCVGAGNMLHAQFLKTIKAKAKAAVDNSVDRSTNKLIDKTINNPADNATDTVLTKSGRKVNSLFKKKKNKDGADNDQATVLASDSTVIKPAGTDSSAAVIPGSDSAAGKPGNQNLKAQIVALQYSAFAANTGYENSCVASDQLSVDGNSHVQLRGGKRAHFCTRRKVLGPLLDNSCRILDI